MTRVKKIEVSQGNSGTRLNTIALSLHFSALQAKVQTKGANRMIKRAL